MTATRPPRPPRATRKKRPQPPMTEEQRRLAADNMPLVGYFISRAKEKYTSLRDPATADEAFGEGYATLCRCVRILDPEKGRLSTLVGTSIFRDIARAAKKPRNAERTLSPEKLAELAVDGRHEETLSSLIHEEKLELLRKHLRKLPALQRVAIEMVFFDGMSQRAAAQLCRTTHQAVASRIMRGLARLRRAMTKEEDS